MLDTPCSLSYLRAEHVYEGSLCGDEGTHGYELVAGVGASADSREAAPRHGAH
jgi:hypothetical protein